MRNNKLLRFRISEELLNYCKSKTNISKYIRTLIRNEQAKTDPNSSPEIRAKSPYTFYANFVRVVDGDTFVLDADLGFYIYAQVKVRLADIDVPPITTTIGKKAAQFIDARLSRCHLVIESRQKDKYGRYLAYIYYHRHYSKFEDILRFGKAINDELLKNKLAEKYKD